MTERNTTRRRRRTAGVLQLPSAIVAWFAGEPRPPQLAPVPLAARGFPGHVLLPDWWAAWQAERPSAVPPAGFEWLIDPGDLRNQRPAWLHQLAVANHARA